MDRIEILERWLRIGFSHKPSSPYSARGRRRTGEKGIGRISTDRLGSRLELKSTKGDRPSVGLTVDWDSFSTSGQDLTQVPVFFEERVDTDFLSRIKSRTGTELLITNLRQLWSPKELRELHQELSILTSPFAEAGDFSIIFMSDMDGVPVGPVKSPFWDVAAIRVQLNFDGTIAQYKLLDKDSSRTPAASGTLRWEDLVQRAGRWQQATLNTPTVGPVKIELLFYPRKSDVVAGTSFSLSDLREFLNINAGVKLYRDDIRVRPYGDLSKAEGDWLALSDRKSRDPAGASRRGFRITANQLVGAVFIKRDANREIRDSASREGLVHDAAFYELRMLVLAAVTLLEAHYHEVFRRRPTPPTSATDNVSGLSRRLGELESRLRKISLQDGSAPESADRNLKRAVDSIFEVQKQIRTSRSSIEELVTQAMVFRGLATVGIAAAVFGHETQTAVDQFLGSCTTAVRLLTVEPPRVSTALQELVKAERAANQVAAWGAFSLTRVRRDKRHKRITDIHRLIDDVVGDLKPAFDSLSIGIDCRISRVRAKTFAMDVEAVTLNLLANAYSAVQQRPGKRNIEVELSTCLLSDGRNGFQIAIGDSGPGVAEELREKIWTPLFTTKHDSEGRSIGTGLGLTIVASIVDDLKGTRSVRTHPSLGGALFTICLPAGG